MSIFELLLVATIAIFVLRPEDIPSIIKHIKNIRSYFLSLWQDVMNKLNEPDDLNDINRYLEKIAALGDKYDGEYSLAAVKTHYLKLLKAKSKNDL